MGLLPSLPDPQPTCWFLQSLKQSQVFLLQQRKPRQAGTGPLRPALGCASFLLGLLLILQPVRGTCTFSLVSRPDSRQRLRSFAATPA